MLAQDSRKALLASSLVALSLVFLLPLVPVRSSTPYMELVVVNNGVVLYQNDNVSGQVTILVQNGQIRVNDFPHSGLYPITSQVNEYPKVCCNPYMELVVVNGGVILYENDNVATQVTIFVQSGQFRVNDFPHSGLYPLTSAINEYPKS